MPSNDSLKTRQDLSVGRKKYAYYSLPAAEEAGLTGIGRLPRSMKVLLENLLRNEDGVSVTEADLRAVAAWIDRLQTKIAMSTMTRNRSAMNPGKSMKFVPIAFTWTPSRACSSPTARTRPFAPARVAP